MRARLLDVDDPAWPAALAGTQHDVYHLPGYVAAAALAEGGHAQALLVEDGPERRMLLPLVRRPIGDGRSDATSPYGYPGPVVAGAAAPGFLPEAMAEGIALLRAERAVSLFIRLHPLLDSAGLEQAGALVEHGRVVVMDLSRSDEELWRQTRSNHRRDIGRAVDAGATFSFETSSEAWATFRRLYAATMQRREASDYYHFSDVYFEALRRGLGEQLHLAVVALNGHVAGAGLFTSVAGIVQLHLAGWDEDLAQHRPTKLMYDRVRRWAKARGDRWFSLGGGLGGRDDGLFHFKLGFSPDTRVFRTLRVVVDAAEYERLAQQDEALVGETDAADFFPAYRTRLAHSR